MQPAMSATRSLSGAKRTSAKPHSLIAQKGLPALRRWLPSPRHVFCHGGLSNIDAEFE
jgi:hypothetical protein